MGEPEVFQLADRTLNEVVGQIREDQWTMTMPPSFARKGDQRLPSLRDIISAHAYDDAWVPDMLAGHTMEEVGPERYSGDLLGDNPSGNFATLVETACDAAAQVDDLDQTVHCSFGDYSVREYFWQINMFRGLRAYDLAEVIGISLRLPDDLVQGIWDEVSPLAEEWRNMGIFPEAVAVSKTAPLLDRLLALTGRQPPKR